MTKEDKRIRNLELTKGRIELNRQRLKAIKQFNGCEQCGYNKNTAALCFHHRGEKHAALSGMLSYSWKRILKELEDCEVLCANCHAEGHNK